MTAPVDWRRLALEEAVSGAGVAAAEHPLAARAAAWALERGGNAVDAAVAASLVLSVVLPHLSGLGGDYFALIIRPGGEAVFVDGGGRAPNGLTPQLLEARGHRRVPRRGPLSPTVPGLVDALRVMHESMGRLEWGELARPAIALARRGFPVSAGLARASAALSDLLEAIPGGGSAYAAASRHSPLRLPGLADALESVAGDPRSFYEGDIARAIAGYVRGLGGVLSEADMAGYRARLTRPLELRLPGGCRALEAPPPTQGAAALHALHAALSLGLEVYGEEWPGGPWRLDAAALAAAVLPAYRLRDELIGDPDYMEVGPGELVSPSTLARVEAMASRLASKPPAPRRPPGSWGAPVDTTFYVVADADGTLVAGIQSLYYPYGSGLVEPRFQVVLNNRASDFAPQPGRPSSLRPGARPPHTLSTLALECPGYTRLLGTSGGHYRPQIHLQLALNTLAGMTPGEAVAAPRVLLDVPSWTVHAEAPDGAAVAAPPRARVQRAPYPARAGVAAALERRGDGVLIAAADPRGDGSTASQAPW